MNLLLYLLSGVFLLSCHGKPTPAIAPSSSKKKQHAKVKEIGMSENSQTNDTDLFVGVIDSSITTESLVKFSDYTIWNNLLKKYVDDRGNVNYQGFKKEERVLSSFLEQMAQSPPKSDWKKNEKLAYYINLYNAATVKLIVDHYPTKSIKDIPYRWKKKWIAVGDDTTSLNDIEHEVLRKMNEPRIHFAINCASYSCPKLLNVAFTPQSMERLLSKTAMDFINDKSKNRFENGTARLSKIFKWYKGDFTDKAPLLQYINIYLQNPVSKKAKIEYLDYDWSLNEAK